MCVKNVPYNMDTDGLARHKTHREVSHCMNAQHDLQVRTHVSANVNPHYMLMH